MPIFNSHTGQQIASPNMAGLFLCVDGNANMFINGISHQFSPGSMCIISPFLFVEIVSVSDDFKWEMICDNKDVFHSVAIFVFKAITKSNLFKNPVIQLDKEQIGEFMFFIEKIRNKQLMLDKANKEDLPMLRHNITLLEQAAGAEFISLYFQKLPRSSYKASRNENVVYDFISALSDNYSMHRDVDWYAKQANLSQTYFSQIVHQNTGYTPSTLIKHITIAYIKMFLANHQLSIKETAVRLNFTSQITFNKYFKNCTGMSPSEYRKTILG